MIMPLCDLLPQTSVLPLEHLAGHLAELELLAKLIDLVFLVYVGRHEKL